MDEASASISLFEKLADALQQELTLLNKGRRSMTMFSGHRTGSFAGRTYYRFEVPEDILLRTIEMATFTFGRSNPLTMEGNIITMENQFVTVALPQDFGPSLPEVEASWDYSAQIQPTLDLLASLKPDETIPRLMLNPADTANAHAVPFDPVIPDKTPPDQATAISRAMENVVTMVWGPILSGKTHVLGSIASNYLKGGKSVLFVSPSNEQVDDMLLRTVEIGTSVGVDMAATAARYDLPTLNTADEIAPYSFEHQVESAREEKRKVFQERVTLLKAYWDVRVKQILHEDFYQRTQDMRDTVAALRKKADATTKELGELKQKFTTLKNASLIDKMKRGFSKDDLVAAQKKLQQKQQHLKHIQQFEKTLINDITTIELNAPINAAETKSFNATVKRIDELGGIETVGKAVKDFTNIDEATLLKDKSFIATSVATARMDPMLKGRKFDMVIVDDAQVITLPTLVSLSAMAKEKVVVGGDPFQIEPDALLNNEAGATWLQSDIFLSVAGTETLNDLFTWAETNKQWSVFLSSHFATTPKLSLFVGKTFFDDKINVFAPPAAKGRIIFIDTSSEGGRCRQYLGKKKILPFNEVHAGHVVECIKHAYMDGGRTSGDLGVVLPFPGPTLYTKQQVRMEGLRNIEIGTPHSFRGRRKKALIFDTTMAGVDYTMKTIDDKKKGKHSILRLLNTIFSCVEQDLYIIADMGHFRSMYKDRLLTTTLLALQEQADLKQPVFFNQVRAFDALDRGDRLSYYSITKGEAETMSIGAKAAEKEPEKEDHELKLQMKLMAKKEQVKAPGDDAHKIESEIVRKIDRTLGLRMDVNFLSLYTGGDLLFHNSHETDIASEKLPRDIVSGNQDFQKVMEYWNLLIYDTSGGNKTAHPLLTHKGPETRARQEVKHLRSFYSSDVGAAISEGKNKIAAEVTKIFQSLLGKNQPGNPIEWARAYIKFLERLEAYLTWIAGQIRV
jgi:hypothetical protein